MYQQNPVAPLESAVHPQNPGCTYSVPMPLETDTGSQRRHMNVVKSLTDHLIVCLSTCSGRYQKDINVRICGVHHLKPSDAYVRGSTSGKDLVLSNYLNKWWRIVN